MDKHGIKERKVSRVTWEHLEEWVQRLDDLEVVYLWVDGVYVKAGLELEKEKAALLVVIGALSDGRKGVLSVIPEHRESTESWSGTSGISLRC